MISTDDSVSCASVIFFDLEIRPKRAVLVRSEAGRRCRRGRVTLWRAAASRRNADVDVIERLRIRVRAVAPHSAAVPSGCKVKRRKRSIGPVGSGATDGRLSIHPKPYDAVTARRR